MILTVDGKTWNLESHMSRTIVINARELTAEEFNAPTAIESRLRKYHAAMARRERLRGMCELAQRRTIKARVLSWLDQDVTA